MNKTSLSRTDSVGQITSEPVAAKENTETQVSVDTAHAKGMPLMTPRSAQKQDGPMVSPVDNVSVAFSSSSSQPSVSTMSSSGPLLNNNSRISHSPPTISARSGHVRTDPMPSSRSSSTALATTSSAAPSNSNQAQTDDASSSCRVAANALPSPQKIARPKEVARLLVLACSNRYKKPLGGDTLNRILRDGATVISKNADSSERKVNVIAEYLTPFMEHHFAHSPLNHILSGVEQSYLEHHEAILKLHDQYGDGNKFCRGEDTHQLMQPIISPLINFICGSDKSVKTCGLPAPIVEMMLEVDECIAYWYDECGQNDPDERMKARRNALTSFFGTRSFMSVWSVSLLKKGDIYRPLVSFINTYLNLHLEKFADSLMNCDEENRTLIRKKAKIYTSRTAYNSASDASTESGEKVEQAQKEKVHKNRAQSRKSGLFPLLPVIGKDRMAEEPLSPRDKPETKTRNSPVNPLKTAEALKNNAARDQTIKMQRAKVSDAFAKEYQLVRCPEFFRVFKHSLLELDRDAYKAAKQNLLAYCRDLLNAYIKRTSVSESADKSQVEALFGLAQDLDKAAVARANGNTEDDQRS